MRTIRTAKKIIALLDATVSVLFTALLVSTGFFQVAGFKFVFAVVFFTIMTFALVVEIQDMILTYIRTKEIEYEAEKAERL